MARPYVRPGVGFQAVQQLPLEQMQLFAASQLNKGMITIIDPADIPPEAVVLAKNCNIRFDKTGSRAGFSVASLISPNVVVSPIIRIDDLKVIAGTRYIFIFKANGEIWYSSDMLTLHQVTGGTGAILDPRPGRLTTAMVYDQTLGDYRLVIADNILKKIQMITFGSPDKIDPIDLGSSTTMAPKAKFVTKFDNRVVAAYSDVSPITVYWSADGLISEWDPAVDPSAGSNPLVETPGDVADFITGLYGFTNLLIIMRENSIWLATKQPIASSPFNFFAAVPGIGCNCPYSMAVVPSGLVFADTKTGSVWHYSYSYSYGYVQGGTAPERIGLPVETDIMAGISDPQSIFGSYSAQHNEYTLFIPSPNNGPLKAWTFNFRSKAWSYQEYDVSFTEFHDVDAFVGSGTTIEQLTGTIEQLSGTIESLGNTIAVTSSRLAGTSTALVAFEDSTAVIDQSVSGVGGINYAVEIQSKDFLFPDIDMYVGEIRVEYKPYSSGALEIDYSKDGGNTWIFGKVIKTTNLNIPQIIRYRKQIRTRRLRFRIRSSNDQGIVPGLFDVVGYEVHVYPGGESRSNPNR